MNGVLVSQPSVDLHIGCLVFTNTHTDTTYLVTQFLAKCIHFDKPLQQNNMEDIHRTDNAINKFM